jgi:PKD repeat protein
MKMKKDFIRWGLIIPFLMSFLLFSCKKDTPPPTASFTYSINDGTVTFTAEVTNDTKYEWDFGDGSYINTLHAPVHTYTQIDKAVDYTVSLTIKGPGGITSVSQKITILGKTKLQYLTGGTAASPKSRTWRINQKAAFLDVAAADANFTSQIPSSYRIGGILASVGLANAYKDVFIFKSDGTIKMTSNGGGVLTSLAYSMGNAITPISMYADLGLAYSPITPSTNATFTINEHKNYTITTPLGNVTYSDVLTISFANGGFLGLRDFTTECIVKNITDTSMDVVLFFAHPKYGAKPMLALVVTMEAISTN